MDIAALAQNQPASAPTQSGDTFSALGSEEFFQLIITDLLNQDPLEPTDNEKLLQQIASVRDLEVNRQITDSLQNLMQQQRFGGAADLIGKYVEVHSGDGLGSVGSLVSGVTFDSQGMAVLKLANGTQAPLNNIMTILAADQYEAEMLKGMFVVAETQKDGQAVRVEGIVTEVKNHLGEIVLELDNGEQVALADVTETRAPETA